MSRRRVKSNKKTKRLSSRKASKPKRLDVSLDELKEIIKKAKAGGLTDAEAEKLEGAVDTLAVVTNELELKGASARRLRRLLFGPSSEKTKNIFGEDADASSDKNEDKERSVKNSESNNASDSQDENSESVSSDKDKKKRKGHGRNGANDYKGADKQKISHQTLKPKDKGIAP